MKDQRKPTRLELLVAAHKEMDELQISLSDFGASDTEPDWHYQDAVRNAINGKAFGYLSAKQWELFSDMSGANRAAQKMNKATRKVVDLILWAPLKEQDEIREWVSQNFLRVDI